MQQKRLLIILLISLILVVLGGCRDRAEEATPGPTPTTVPAGIVPGEETPAATPVEATPTTVPTPTLVSLGLVPSEADTPLVPRLVGQNPAQGAEVALDGVLELYFDQPMDPALTAAAWQLVDENGAEIAGEVTWPQPRVLRFRPQQSLKPNSRYQAKLAKTAAAVSGSSLLEGLTLTFDTIGDLSVSQVSPVAEVTEVGVDSAITIIFNRPVVSLGIAEAMADLPDPLSITPTVAGQGEWLNTSVYLFRPETALAGQQRYLARVSAQVVNALSASGAVMVDDYEWSFVTTAPTISYLNLVDLTSSPQDEYVNMPLDQAFQVIFAQPMDPGRTEAAISLRPDSGRAAALQFGWDEMFTTVTFTPTQDLQLGARYTLQVDEAAASASGGRLRQGLTWHGFTVQPPEIISAEPGNGTTQRQFSSILRLNFASPMDRDSLKGKVIISPEPAGDLDGQYDAWDWSLRFYGLAPSTTYTVQVLPGMRDPYGNSISEGRTFMFTTAPYTPVASFNFPGRLSLYRQGGSTAVWVDGRNVSQLDVALYQINLRQFASLLDGSINQVDFAPEAASLVWSESRQISAQLNQRIQSRFELNQAGGELPPGFYFITLDSPQVSHEYRHLQAQPLLLASANLTLKTTATEAMIWLTDLASGEPLAEVPVTFYDQNFQPIFSEATDGDGLIYRDNLDLEAGYQATYYALTDAAPAAPFGLAISGWNEGVNAYDFGIYTDFYLQPGQPTVYVYTDRPIYRPGQDVSFKGIVRLNDDLSYSLPAYRQVSLTVESFEETIYSESLPLSEFGTFSAQLALDEEAALGSYYISVRNGEEWIGSGYFEVAEYRKPTFQVDVAAAESDLLAGDTIRLSVSAQFFSGGAVVNSPVEWSLYSSSYLFQPGGNLSRYSFNDEERDAGYYEFGFYNPVKFIASGTGQTDAQGNLQVEIPAELAKEEGSRNFSFEATVTDIAGNAVSGRTEVIVHRSLVYPGIRPQEYVGVAGQPTGFDVTLVDWQAQPVGRRPIAFEVVERRWYSVQEENEQGQTIWRTTVAEIPIYATTDLTLDGQGRLSASFVPPRGGVYRAYVTAQDELGNEAVASTYVWVAGEEFVPWRRLNDHSFELIANADSYQPGDTAEILIASPFPGQAHALVTVERGHIKQHEVIRLDNNSTIYRLPINGQMAPNVFVSVMVIKGVDEGNPIPDFKVGMTQFSVEREEQELQVEIRPDRTTAGPGDEVTYAVRVRDHAGRPVEAEVSLALVDLAALSIAQPNAPSILDHFYSQRWLSVNTALLLTRLMDGFNRELEDQMKGGGGGGGDFGVITVREDFPDTAYWQGQVQTGADGETSVTVTLPDNLTTWRMDARAVTLDTLVGQATSDLVATLPLLVSPQTPRFFVVGDTALLGTAVHNNTGAALEVRVHLQAEGVSLDSPAEQLVTVPAGQQALVQWSVTVQDVSRVDLVFSASSGDLADASRPPMGSLDGQGIPVYRYEVPETVGTSGQLTEGGAVVESISLPIIPDFELTQAEVTVEVAPSLAAAMTEGLDYLAHYPHECTEQIVSRFLPNVLTTRALKAAGLSDPQLEKELADQVNIALQRLYSRQRADGGWPWWDGLRTDTLVTAYVVQALVEARDAGYPVSDGVIERGVTYLQDHLAEVDGLDGRYKFNRQAYLVYVLARLQQPPTTWINRLYEQREALDLYARAYLAQAIILMDAADPRLETIAADFISSAQLSASGTHWQEVERDDWNWNSDTRTTAVVLDTLIRLAPDNPLVANGVRWLMAHRSDGRWASTQETAWTLMALTNWMVASGELEADYLYEIALNGQLRGTGEANSDTLRQTWKLQVDLVDLFIDQLNRLAIGRSDGPGNLYYTTHLQAFLPVEQVKALDRGIIISRSYFDPDDRQTAVNEMSQGETFLARLTIVVPHSLHYAVIEDYLPAGLEAVDTSLKTSQQLSAPERYDWDDNFSQGWGWWVFDHVELRDEKVVLSADYLPPGTYEYVYLVRASTPGEYRVIPPTAQEFYFPEVYGRGDGALFVVRPRS